MENNLKTWAVDSIRYFRLMGFFDQFRHLDDSRLANRLMSDELVLCWEEAKSNSVPQQSPDRAITEDDEELHWLRPRPDELDLVLLGQDAARIWWEDGEGDIAPSNDKYVCALGEWSRISRGTFLPTDIHEIWDKPDEWPDTKMDVSFSLDGSPCILEPWDGYGWLDFGLLNGINSLISASGFQYEMWNTGDQTTCLVVLTMAEKNRLETERGWEFIDSVSWGAMYR